MLGTTRRMCRIVDDHYDKFDLYKVDSESKHLIEQEQATLHNLSTKYDSLFDATLHACKTKPVDILMQPYAKLYHTHDVPCS